MHVLILSLWYYPEPVTKPHDLATELVDRGHTVSVVTGFPNYPTGVLYDGNNARSWQRDNIDGVNVVRIPVLIDRSRSGRRRIISYSSFTASAIMAGVLLTPRPDVVWTYQIGLPGIAIASLRRSKLVHEVQDLWPEWALKGHMGVDGLAYRILDRQEKFIYSHADVVTTISSGFKRKLIEKGVPGEKIEIIPNWANEQLFRPVVPDKHLAMREGLAGRFNIIYGGNIGSAQGLKNVLDVADLLKDIPMVQFVLVGDGVEKNRLAREAVERNIKNLRFMGSRSPDQMAHYYALADALLLTLSRDPAYELTIPSKTYAYLACGRPVLAAAAGDVTELIREIGAGLACNPEDPLALANIVRVMYHLPEAQRQAMGQRGRHAFITRFTRQALGTRYEDLFAKIVANKMSR